MFKWILPLLITEMNTIIRRKSMEKSHKQRYLLFFRTETRFLNGSASHLFYFSTEEQDGKEMPSWKLIYHCIRHLVLQETVQFLNNLQNHNDILYSATDRFEENNSDRFDDTVGERKLIHDRGIRRWKRTMWTKEAWAEEIRIYTIRLKRGRNRKRPVKSLRFTL